MHLLNKPFQWLLKQRLNRLQAAINNPIETQHALLKELIQQGKYTLYGKQFSYHTIDSPQAFQRQVPICSYEQLYPHIAQALQGTPQVLWPTPIRWFAKSSGTTNDRSKYIPVSEEALQEGHYKAGKDMLAIYLTNNPASQLAQGKSLAMAGSLYSNSFSPGSSTQYGDVSAVIMRNLPFWAKWISTPNIDITLLDNWEEKLEKLAQATIKENITSITGIPTWVLLLLNRVLAIKQAASIVEVWPMLELFIHGGVSFVPYKDLFDQLVPPHMHYMEVYNASEGFFAVQDQLSQPALLLLVDHGIYYEFIPIEDVDKPAKQALDLSAVELNKVYALVITTNSGLWRYQVGDTVRFTSLSPYRLQVVGRTKHFINAFGEELMIHQAESAISYACACTGATINDYTAGPSYLSNGQQGKHEWVIEFVQPPAQLHEFIDLLDHQLQAINSDYEAKRYKDMLLTKPVVRPVPPGFFYTWMKNQDKLGEQHKVPRLFNSRKYLDSIHQLLQETAIEYPSERLR